MSLITSEADFKGFQRHFEAFPINMLQSATFQFQSTKENKKKVRIHTFPSSELKVCTRGRNSSIKNKVKL